MKKIKSLALSLALFWSLNGCQKNPVMEDVELPDDEITVAQAKAFVEMQKLDQFTLKSGSMQNHKINIRADWSKAESSSNGQVSVVETQIQAQGLIGFITRDSHEAWKQTNNEAYLRSMSRLVVLKVKKTGEIYSFIMSIAADRDYSQKKNFKYGSNTYLKRDKDFSGGILFHNLTGDFVNGWIYCDGQITHSITDPDNTGLAIQLKTAAERAIYVYYEYCVDYYSVGSVNGVVISEDFMYTNCIGEWVYMGSYSTGGTSGTSNTSGGTPGGYIPSTPIPPNPCNCVNTCEICGKCLDNTYLKSATLPTGGGTTTSSDCEICGGHTLEQIARSQLEYLKQRGAREMAEIFEQLLLDPTLPMSDVYAIYSAIESAYLQLKAEYVMAIFSPDNVAAILALYFSSNITETSRIKAFELLKQRNITVLGSYPNYITLANDFNATRFSIPTNIWNSMDDVERWAANQKFLDDIISRGDDIILATPANQADVGTYFWKELQYLYSKGYKVSPNQLRLYR